MKEKLNEKLKELKQQQAKALANYNAICGAVQFCEQLIAEEDENENCSD